MSSYGVLFSPEKSAKEVITHISNLVELGEKYDNNNAVSISMLQVRFLFSMAKSLISRRRIRKSSFLCHGAQRLANSIAYFSCPLSRSFTRVINDRAFLFPRLLSSRNIKTANLFTALNSRRQIIGDWYVRDKSMN